MDAATITSIASLVAAIGACCAVFVGYLNNRRAAAAAYAAEAAKVAAEASQREVIATKDGVFEIGKQIDGRLTELLATSKALAHAEGIAEGRKQ